MTHKISTFCNRYEKESIRKERLYNSNKDYYRLLSLKRYYEQKINNTDDEKLYIKYKSKLKNILNSLENILKTTNNSTYHKPLKDNTKQTKLDISINKLINHNL